MINKPYFSQILQFKIQSGDSKVFVATFVAMERMWLDTAALTHQNTSDVLGFLINKDILKTFCNTF
jgi:hypothetical protein